MLKSDCGFTMIELLLVLLGTALLVNIGLSTQKSVSRMQLSMTAREIQSLIREAQCMAYGEQSIHSVGFYSDTQKCMHIKNSRKVKEIEMPQGITMKQTNFPKMSLSFTRSLSPSSGGTIELFSKTHQLKMTVLPATGRVMIYPLTKK